MIASFKIKLLEHSTISLFYLVHDFIANVPLMIIKTVRIVSFAQTQ